MSAATTTLIWFRRLFVFLVAASVTYFIFFAGGGAEEKEAKEKQEIKMGMGQGGNGNAINPKEGGVEKVVNVVKNFFSPEKPAAPKAKAHTPGNPDVTIQLIHLHHPSNQGSVNLARTIEEVRLIHPEQVFVTTIDVSKEPAKLGEWRVSAAPAVVIQSDSERIFAFEGFWPTERLAPKVEEILHGLRRVGKDWRPEVKGMTPSSGHPSHGSPR